MSKMLARKVAHDLSGVCDLRRPVDADSPASDSGGRDSACAGSEIDFRPPAAEYKGRSAAAESGTLLRALWHSSHRLRIALFASGIVAVLLGNMAGQLRLNSWNGAFFDAVAQRSLSGLTHQLLIFVVIIAALLTLVVAQTWLQQMLKVRLREWLTQHLLEKWLVPGRPYRFGLAGPIGANPDQRIEEDARKLTELSASLAVGLLQAVLLLVSFIGMLWVLSDRLVFSVDGVHFTIPGYMVWCAVAYAGIGSLLAWRVGRPLIGLNAELYAKEAELRFALVRVSESAESIGLVRGEQDERRQLNGTLDRVIGSMKQLSGALSGLTWITSGYGWIAIVVPIVVALPGYFSGGVTLGGLMMVVGAFNQVQSSLRWFVDQFPSIADWRATLHRVSAFKAAVEKLDEIDKTVDTISLVEHVEDMLAFESVSVLTADGRVVIAEATVDVVPGERVLIVGESGIGKSTLFRAVAGLWPWGSGTIRLPNRNSTMFMPQRPYLPLGTMRAAIAYPDPADAFPTADVAAVMRRVGLKEFIPALDRTARLDNILSLGQQQLVGFARLLLHRPTWVFLDEATSALDEFSQRRVMSVFDNELRNSSLLSIGHRPGLEAFHTRTLHLVRTPAGARLYHCAEAAPANTSEAETARKAAGLHRAASGSNVLLRV